MVEFYVDVHIRSIRRVRRDERSPLYPRLEYPFPPGPRRLTLKKKTSSGDLDIRTVTEVVLVELIR